MATYVNLQGKNLARFNRVMQEVSKETQLVRKQSIVMAREARIVAENAYFNC